jgi:hypothetical protein
MVKQTTPKESLDRNSIIKTLKYKMNILDKIIVDKEEKSFSKINHSCFSIRSLCLSQKRLYHK